MGKYKITRFLDSTEEEEVIENENLQNSTFKEGFREYRSGTYIQKIRKIKRNSWTRYDSQSGKVIPSE